MLCENKKNFSNSQLTVWLCVTEEHVYWSGVMVRLQCKVRRGLEKECSVSLKALRFPEVSTPA